MIKMLCFALSWHLFIKLKTSIKNLFKKVKEEDEGEKYLTVLREYKLVRNIFLHNLVFLLRQREENAP